MTAADTFDTSASLDGDRSGTRAGDPGGPSGEQGSRALDHRRELHGEQQHGSPADQRRALTRRSRCSRQAGHFSLRQSFERAPGW